MLGQPQPNTGARAAVPVLLLAVAIVGLVALWPREGGR